MQRRQHTRVLSPLRARQSADATPLPTLCPDVNAHCLDTIVSPQLDTVAAETVSFIRLLRGPLGGALHSGAGAGALTALSVRARREGVPMRAIFPAARKASFPRLGLSVRLRSTDPGRESVLRVR